MSDQIKVSRFWISILTDKERILALVCNLWDIHPLAMICEFWTLLCSKGNNRGLCKPKEWSLVFKEIFNQTLFIDKINKTFVLVIFVVVFYWSFPSGCSFGIALQNVSFTFEIQTTVINEPNTSNWVKSKLSKFNETLFKTYFINAVYIFGHVKMEKLSQYCNLRNS